jgi:hypothetical protein
MTTGGVMVGLLVSSTTFSGHLRSDLIRIVAPSMTSDRSGKLCGGSGKDQPAISRRATSALPTTIKYLAMGTADSSRASSNRGQPMAAMLDHAHVARQIDKGCHTAASPTAFKPCFHHSCHTMHPTADLGLYRNART